jgi:hypothetical protein
MTHGSKSAGKRKKHQQQMRVRGYQDGLQGRPSAVTDPDYLASYRRGLQRAEELRKEKPE